MKNIKIIVGIALMAVILYSCNSDNYTNEESYDAKKGSSIFSGDWIQEDQMGRPAVNTVFVSSTSKDMFNVTVPSQQNAAFQSMIQTNLEALSPAFSVEGDKNALGLDSQSFANLLSTDVLNVSMIKPTTFFDGVNVLTGRTLADDVITVELLLIFGGEDFTENPGLSNDNVDANDKPFLTSFPYMASPW